MKRKKVYKWCIGIFSFAIFNIFLKLFVIDIHRIAGDSMYPMLKNGDYVVVSKMAYGVRLPRNLFEIPWVGTMAYYCFSDSFINKQLAKKKDYVKLGNSSCIKRNDIIVFNMPTLLRCYAVKRCIAIPGDSIKKYTNDSHSPWLTPFEIVPYKGMKIEESTLTEVEKKVMKQNINFTYLENENAYLAKEDCFFVLGDNKSHSEDSRLWGFIPSNLVIGKVLITF